MKKKTQHNRLVEYSLLAFGLVLGVRMALPLVQEGSTAFTMSDMAKWTGQIVPGTTLDPVLPLPPLTGEVIMSDDVTTLQGQLAEARATISSLESQIRTLQDQLNVALSGDIVPAEPLRFAPDGTPYADPVDAAAQGLLCMYFKVGC